MSDFPDPFAPRSTPIEPTGDVPFAPQGGRPLPPPPPPPPPFPGALSVPPGYIPYADSRPLFVYSGWWRRAGAFVLDGAVGAALYMPGFLYLQFGPQQDAACFSPDGIVRCTEPTDATAAVGLILIVAGIIGFLLLYCMMAARGGSPGQRAVGIRIVDARTGEGVGPWRIFGRRAASYLSSLPCYLGFLWPLWDQRKQTWHDMIAKTVVVKVR
ncbi:MAG: hypothetical protein RL238_1883 [Actinomycetota bacterium]|jgi:uncharacterized RDD family membrane protein YckC